MLMISILKFWKIKLT